MSKYSRPRWSRCLTDLELSNALTVSKEVAVALQNADKNNVDITDKLNNPSVFCGKPGCLGKPWCSSWGICKEASMASPDYEDELFYQLSQQLDSNSALLEEHSSSTLPSASTSPHFPALTVPACSLCSSLLQPSPFQLYCSSLLQFTTFLIPALLFQALLFQSAPTFPIPALLFQPAPTTFLIPALLFQSAPTFLNPALLFQSAQRKCLLMP